VKDLLVVTHVFGSYQVCSCCLLACTSLAAQYGFSCDKTMVVNGVARMLSGIAEMGYV